MQRNKTEADHRVVIFALKDQPFRFQLSDEDHDQSCISTKVDDYHNMLDLSSVLVGSEQILHVASINQGFFLVHADMTITELTLLGDVWKMERHTGFKTQRLEIKFIDGGEGNLWIVTKCNRLFNYGSDTIFKQRGKLLSDSNVGLFKETSSEFLNNNEDEKREITHFSCGRYHTCLSVNRRWAYGCGYSSFYQTGTNNSADTDTFNQSLFHVDGKSENEMKHTIRELHCGRYFTLILSDNLEVWVTGSNENNQIFSSKSFNYYHKLNIFQSVIRVYAAKLGYHSMAVTGGQQIGNPGPYAVCSNGWNDNGQLGTKHKNESEMFSIVDLPDQLAQNSPDVANLEIFPIFTRTFFRYKSNIYETNKQKGKLELILPFKVSFMDDVKIVGGSEFTLISVTEKYSKMIRHFFRQLENSYRNRHLSDIRVIITNTAY